jgi:tetratricopeptide (TPR) repeat protein/ankyrin repeat protein
MFSPNKPNELITAARDGDIKTLQGLLVQGGVSHNAQTDIGECALHAAAQAGQKEVVDYLINREARIGLRDHSGQTPLHKAICCGKEAVAKQLLQQATLLEKEEVKALADAWERARKEGLESTFSKFQTAKMSDKMAITVDTVLQKEYIALPNYHFLDWVQKAYRESITSPQIRAEDRYVNARDTAGDTPLHLAILQGHGKIVNLLLEDRAELELFSAKGLTPLHQAILGNRKEFVAVLLDKGARLEQVTAEGLTPLHLALDCGHVELVECLLQRGANIHAKDKRGWTVLHRAAERGYTAIVQWLLKNKADPDIRCPEKRAAVHFAAEQGKFDTVETLVCWYQHQKRSLPDPIVPVQDALLAGIQEKQRAGLSIGQINWSGCAISDEMVRKLMVQLEGCTTLKQLNLAHNQISYLGAGHLAQFLRVAPPLTALDLSGNAIGGHRGSGAQVIFNALEGSQLTVLQLANCRLDKVDVEVLLGTLNENNSLKFLNLEQNPAIPTTQRDVLRNFFVAHPTLSKLFCEGSEQLSAHEWFKKGQKLSNSELYQEAFVAFNLARADDQDKEVWVWRGFVLNKLGDYPSALEAFEQALTLDRQHEGAWVNKKCVLISKGRVLISLERYGEAIAVFDEALTLDPHDKEVWNDKGLALIRIGCCEKAIEAFDQALTLDPRYQEAWHNKGVALARLGRYDDAIEAYDKALTLAPQDKEVLSNKAAAWNGKGVALAKSGCYGEAITAYEEALTCDPQFKEAFCNKVAAWNDKGVALAKSGHYGEAIKAYEEALTLDPRYQEALNNKGVALASLEHYEEAIAVYEIALALDPKYQKAWTNKGHALISLECYEEAIFAYDQALPLDPPHQLVLARLDRHEGVIVTDRNEKVVAWNKKGVVLANSECYEQAIAAYHESLNCDPQCKEAWNNKGVALESLERYEQAMAAYESALTLDPHYQKVLNNKAITWNKKGVALARSEHFEEAIKAYDEALTCDPQLKEALNNKGVALESLERYEEAIVVYNKALLLDPDSQETRANKARALTKQGVALAKSERYEEAIAAYDEALTCNPHDKAAQQNKAIAWNKKGVALARSGRYEEAIKAYNEALTCDPQLAEALSNKAVAWNDKGKALECFERYGEAIAAYEEALKYDSHLKVAQDNKAVAWYKKGIDLVKFSHYDAALAAFVQALAHNPTFAKAQEAREAVLQRLKNPTLKSVKPAKTEASPASSAAAANHSSSAQEQQKSAKIEASTAEGATPPGCNPGPSAAADPSSSGQEQQKSAKTGTSRPAEGTPPPRSSPASSSAADNPSSSGQGSQQKSANTGTSHPAEGAVPPRSSPASSAAADNPSSSGQEQQRKSANTGTSHPAEGVVPPRSSPVSSSAADNPSSSAQEQQRKSANTRTSHPAEEATPPGSNPGPSAAAADPSSSGQEQRKSRNTGTSRPAEGTPPPHSGPASSSTADNPSSSGQESQQKSAKTGTSRPAEGTPPPRSNPASSAPATDPSSAQEQQRKSAKSGTNRSAEPPPRSSPASSAPASSSAQEPAGASATPGQDYIRQIIQEGAAYFKLPEELYQHGLLVAICGGFYQELLYLLNPQPEKVDLSSLTPATAYLKFLESPNVQLIKSYEQKLKELNKENPNSSSENLGPYAPLLALAQKSGQLSSMQGLIAKLCEQLPEKSIPPTWLSKTRERTIKNRTLLISDMVDLSDWHPQEIDFTHSFVHLQKAGCRVQTLRLCGWHFLEGEMASLCQALQMPREALAAEQGVQSAPQNTSGVKTLDLSRIHLKKEDVKQLAEMLKVNRSLTTLILRECKLDDAAVKELAAALKHSNTSLIKIDLSYNPQVTVDSAQMLLDLVQAGKIPLRTLELSGNTGIAFWNRQIQKALEVTNDHLADKEIQAKRNFFFALLEERQSSGLPANTATVVEGSDSGEGQLPDTVTGLLEEIPDEATLAEELAQQQTLNKEKRSEILEEITQLKGKSGVELEVSKLKQKIQDLENHYDELARLCAAKKQRYDDQQKFGEQGQEYLWVYYCTLAQRMEEIFIASKAESSRLMGKTTLAGDFKAVALGIILVSKGISTIVKLSDKMVKGVAGVVSGAEWLNEERQHNIIERISLLGSLSDCKKAAYYVARHLTHRYAEQCKQISRDPTWGWGKQAKEWLQTNVLAKKIPSPLALFAECAVQRMLYALMADWIKAPNDKQEVSEWLGEQLVDEVSKPLTETGTLANTVSLKVQSVYQSLCAWFALNTIQTNDGKEWIIPQIYTHTGIKVGDTEYIDPNDLEMIENKTDQTPAKGEIKTKEKKIEPKTNYRLYGCYEGTMDRVTLCGYKALPKKPNQESQVTATAQQSTQANTADQSKVASAQPPVSSKNQAQTNHSSESLPSQQASSIQSMNKYTKITKSEYWYQDKEINRLLLIVSGAVAQVAMPQTPLIKAQNEKEVPCPEVDAGYIQFFQEAIEGALEKDKPTLIPINTVSAVTLDDNGIQGEIEGAHWVLLVLRPNQNEHHRPSFQYIDPFGNGDGEDKDMIQDEVNINDHNVTQSHSSRILNLIKQVKYQEQTPVNPNTFLVTGLQQQDNAYDCGPYLIENAIAVLNRQERVKTNMKIVRKRHAQWLQDEDDANQANRQAGAETAAEASKLAAAQVSAQTADTSKQEAIPATASSSTAKVGEIGLGKNKVGGKNTAAAGSPPQKVPPSGGSSTEKKYANPTASSTNHLSNDAFLKRVRTELEDFKSKLKKDQDQILDNLNKTLPEEIKEKIKNEIIASVEEQLQGLIKSLQTQGLNADLKEKNELERTATQKNEPHGVVNAHQLNPMESELSKLEKGAKKDQLSSKELEGLREKIDLDSKMTTEQQLQEIKKSLQAEFNEQLQKQIEELKKQFQEQLESEGKARTKDINMLLEQLVLEKAAHDSETAALNKQQKEQDERIQKLEEALLPNQPAQEVSAGVQPCVELPVGAPPELPADQADAPAETVAQLEQKPLDNSKAISMLGLFSTAGSAPESPSDPLSTAISKDGLPDPNCRL